MKPRMLRVVAGIALTAAAIVLLLAVFPSFEQASAQQIVGSLHVPSLAGVFAAFAANHALRVVRFHWLLGSPIPWRRTTAVCLVSFLAISTLPLRLGELARPALYAREGVAVGQTLAALVVERMLDLAALLALLAWATTVPLPPVLVDGIDVVVVAQRGATLATAVLAAALVAVIALGERLRPLPLLGPWAAATASAAWTLATPLRTLSGVALTVAIWAAILAYVRFGLGVIDGLPATVEAAGVTWASVMATITALPTPGFFGSFEAGAVAALTLLEAEPQAARWFALGLHLAYLAFVILTAIPAAVVLGRRA